MWKRLAREGIMHSVTVRILAGEFSATMTAIREWLDANRYNATRYKYDHDEDAVLVTVDFSAGVELDPENETVG